MLEREIHDPSRERDCRDHEDPKAESVGNGQSHLYEIHSRFHLMAHAISSRKHNADYIE
jgi:hypothetical protein